MNAGFNPLDLLIAAGWGDVPGRAIPSDVMEDAQRGKEPRPNPNARANDAFAKERPQ